MELETMINLAALGVAVLIGVGGTYFLVFKKKLKQFRRFIDNVDDALYDNTVTEEEFRKIYEAGKALINKG